MAEMTEIHRVKCVRRPAATAVLGVGGVRHSLKRQRVVLDAVVDDCVSLAPEVRHEWIVGVAHKTRLRRRAAVRPRRPSARRSCPARHSGRAGRETGCRARPRADEAAPQADRATARRPRTVRARPRSCRCRPAASSSVEAIPPAMLAPAWLCTSEMPAALEDARGHRRRRGLAVGGRHQHAATGQARRKRADRRGVHPHEQLARQARAASAAHPGDGTDGAGESELRPEHGAHRSAAAAFAPARWQGRHPRPSRLPARAPARRRRSRVTRSGSSPIGSPSAYIVNGRSALIETSRARNTFTLGSRTCAPLNTFGRIFVRNLSLLTLSSTTTSSSPSSSSASGRRPHPAAVGLRVGRLQPCSR